MDVGLPFIFRVRLIMKLRFIASQIQAFDLLPFPQPDGTLVYPHLGIHGKDIIVEDYSMAPTAVQQMVDGWIEGIAWNELLPNSVEISKERP